MHTCYDTPHSTVKGDLEPYTFTITSFTQLPSHLHVYLNILKRYSFVKAMESAQLCADYIRIVAVMPAWHTCESH